MLLQEPRGQTTRARTGVIVEMGSIASEKGFNILKL